MSLEQMKKDDLVKLSRKLQQDVKLLKEQLSELKGDDSEEVEKVDVELPFKAAASVKTTANKSRMYILDFDLDGNCAVRESSFGEIEHYKIQQKVDQFNADVVFRKNIMRKKPVTETQGEDNDGN